MKKERPTARHTDIPGDTKAAPRSHKRKIPSPIPAMSADPHTGAVAIPPSQPVATWQYWRRPTSPLTPSSSDADAEGEDDDTEPYQTFGSAPISPMFPSTHNDVQPPALPNPVIPHPASSPQAGPSSERWWAEISPQPPSSPLSDTRSLSQPDSLGALRSRFTVPPFAMPARLSREYSDSLSSIRWSPRSVTSPPYNDHEEIVDGSIVLGQPAQQDTSTAPDETGPGASALQRVGDVQAAPPLISMPNTFKPRSQAFHRFSPTPIESEQILVPEVKQERDPMKEIQSAWDNLKEANKRMEQAVAGLIAFNQVDGKA